VSAKFDLGGALGDSGEKREVGDAQDAGDSARPLEPRLQLCVRPAKGKEYDVMRADGRGLTPFRFTVVGTEKLATPAGEMQTLHIAKLRDGPRTNPPTSGSPRSAIFCRCASWS